MQNVKSSRFTRINLRNGEHISYCTNLSHFVEYSFHSRENHATMPALYGNNTVFFNRPIFIAELVPSESKMQVITMKFHSDVLRKFVFSLFFLTVIFQAYNLFAQSKQGEKIYLQKCAKCHGKQGEGVETVYPEALIGDLSIKELAQYIDETMPEKKPETCVGKEAAAVAEHIHYQFYSITAQARNKPAHVAFSRLTNRQYRNSIADLLLSFRQERALGPKRGLTVRYFKNRGLNKKNILVEEIVPEVNVSFDNENKPDENIEFEKFTSTWKGSLLAPETGLYELVLKTDNAGLLFLNNSKVPFINARVKSGKQNEYRQAIFLIGGRAYPLSLEIYKSKNEKKVTAQLKWKPPHQSEQIIPSRNLSPESHPAILVINTPFPPDDKSVGYERGVSVSKEWNDATTYAAIEVADKVVKSLGAALPKGANNSKKREAELRKFCDKFAVRAFRRPLSKQLKTAIIDRQFERVEDPLVATRRVILLVLKSPRFLFLGISDPADPQQQQYRVAEWMALCLWDSIPDNKLLELAAQGKLKTNSQIKAQAQRMVKNYRTRSKVRAFFHQWLQYDHFNDLTKSKELYPEFDEHLASDLRTSLDLLIEDVVWSEKSDFRELLSTNSIYLNGRLARFYGVELPEDAPFQRVEFDPTHRAGLISHPFLMAGMAYEDGSSPIHRGVFLARSLMGRFLKPPPIAVAPLEVDLNPDMTTRERVALQTKGALCGSCHGLINQLGFTLEKYDAAGRFRLKDNGKPVNTSGRYIDRDGHITEFKDAQALTAFLVKSAETQTAFSEQLFQYLTKQPAQAFGQQMLPKLRESFEQQDTNMQKLLVEIASRSALANRELSRKKSK